MPHSAKAVANYLLDLADKRGISLTPMQILKLVYIAHGWTLAATNQPLISDAVEAWKYGPVVRSIYDAFKKFGSNPITERACMGKPGTRIAQEEFSPAEAEILAKLFEEFGEKRAFQLSAFTHQVGSPWHKVYTRDSSGVALIPDHEIKAYFLGIANRGQAAAI